MKKKDMYDGKFKLKNGIYPELMVRDYPDTFETLRFLESRVSYFMDENTQTKLPQEMLYGIAKKMENTRKSLRELKNGKPNSNAFFVF